MDLKSSINMMMTDDDALPPAICSSAPTPFAPSSLHLGMPERHADPYYLKRAGRWPIGNTGGEGGNIIASEAPAHPSRRKNSCAAPAA